MSPHLHIREDEYSLVTRGEIGFRSGDREAVLGTKPRDEMHAMWNAGSEPAHMIEMIGPAGFEHFFRELCEMIEDGTAESADVAGLFGSGWLPDVIARYGLAPPS